MEQSPGGQHGRDPLSLENETQKILLHLQWQAENDGEMEMKDRVWRKREEGLRFQIRQLEEKKREALKQLMLALSQVHI